MNKNRSMTRLTVTLSGVCLSAFVNAAPIQECFQDVCSSIDTTSACVAPGEETQISVEGVLEGASGMAFTAYQLIADAEWRYNSNHQFELTGGTTIDSSGFHFGSSLSKHYMVKGGEAEQYTFVFGSRAFGHGFYDVAIDLPIGEGDDSSASMQIDIKPATCPNPVNIGNKGVIPVAIIGTPDLDVRSLDLDSIRLEGVAPVNYSFEDVASNTLKASVYDCVISRGDGTEDLSLKFLTQQLTKAIETKLGRKPLDGEVVTLTMTATPEGGNGSTCGGGLTGQDTIQALVKGKK